MMIPKIQCDNCSKDLMDDNLSRCSRCRLVYYCGSKCQKDHWKIHKNSCISINHTQSISIFEEYMNLIENDEDESLNVESSANIINEEDLHEVFCFACYSSFEDTEPWNPIMKHLAKASKIIRLMRHIRSQQLSPDISEDYEIMLKHCCDKVEEEIDMFEHAYDGGQSHPGALKMMSEMYYVMKEYSKALAVIININESILNQRGKSQLHLQYAKCYIELKDYVSAMKEYAKSIAFMTTEDPCRIEAFLGCSRCFYELGNYEQAIQSSEGVIAINRHFMGAYEYIIKSYEKLGKLDLALAWSKQAIRYETPWDERNVATIKASAKAYESLLKTSSHQVNVSEEKI